MGDSGIFFTATGLHKVYDDRQVLADVNFTLGRGEIVGFLGPNGAGKTTTMRILTGFIPPTEGSVVMEGHALETEPEWIKSRIGYLPETPPLYHEMTATEYVTFVAQIKGVAVDAIPDAVHSALERAHCADVAERPVGKLSRGYRQRVGLAAALVHDPPLLILDEPTAGLDPKEITETRALLRSLAGEKTILFSSHILTEVEAVADRILLIHQGRLIADETTAVLKHRLVTTRIALTLVDRGGDAANFLTEAFPSYRIHHDASLPERIIVTGDAAGRPLVVRRLIERGYDLLDVTGTESLEEVFLSLTEPLPTEEAAE